MVSVTKTLILFVFICCSINTGTCNVRNWIFPIKKSYGIVRPYFTLDENKGSFAACDSDNVSNQKQCNITVTHLDNSETKVCNNIKTYSMVNLIPVATNRVLLVGNDDCFLNIVIVNMVNCTNTELEIPLKRNYDQLPIIVPGNNSFSVIINSTSTCVNVDRCTVTYDLNGQRISSPKTELAPIIRKGFYTVGLSNVPDTGYFLNVLEGPNKMSVLHINPSGVATNLIESEIYEYPFPLSNANKQYGICMQVKQVAMDYRLFRCVQFDEKAKLKLDATVVFSEMSEFVMGPVSIYNLADDGLLLASLTCPLIGLGTDGCRYSVWRIHANGQLVRQNEVKDQNTTCYRDDKDINLDMNARINENEKGELCFDFSCFSNTRNSNDDTFESEAFEIFRNCKPKAEILLQQEVRKAN